MGLLNFIGFQQVLLGFNGFYWVLLGFIGKYRDLLSFTGFCWMFICFSLGFIGFQQVLLGFTEFNRVFSGSCWVLLDFLGFQQVLLGFTGFYRVNRQKSQLAVVPRGSRSPPDLRFRFRGAGVGERCGHPIGFSLVFFFFCYLALLSCYLAPPFVVLPSFYRGNPVQRGPNPVLFGQNWFQFIWTTGTTKLVLSF